MKTHTVKFQVSLSNGETFFEGKGKFQEVAGELSPWQKLMNYIEDNRLEITSLALFTDEGRKFNLPHAGKNPKFAPQMKVEFAAPYTFNLFRYIEYNLKGAGGKITSQKVHSLFTVIEAIYPKFKVQLWVDENDHDNCRVLVVKK